VREREGAIKPTMKGVKVSERLEISSFLSSLLSLAFTQECAISLNKPHFISLCITSVIASKTHGKMKKERSVSDVISSFLCRFIDKKLFS
jgi:hypothetical protein